MLELKCSKCGEIGDDVEMRIDPYQHELFGITEKKLMCYDCYGSSMGDI